MHTTVRRSVRDVRTPKQFLKENPEICQEIEAKVRAYYHLDGEEAAEGAGADASVETAAQTDAE